MFKISIFFIYVTFICIVSIPVDSYAKEKSPIYRKSNKSVIYEPFTPNTNDAIYMLEKEIELNPDNHSLRFVLGTLYFDSGIVKYDSDTQDIIQFNPNLLYKAEIQFKEALKSEELKSLAFYNLGLLEIQKSWAKIIDGLSVKKDNYFPNSQAIEYFKNSINADPTNLIIYLKLNAIYLIDKRLEDAIELMENAKTKFKNEYAVYYNLSINYLSNKNYIKAIDNAKVAVSISETKKSMILLAAAYYLMNDIDNAIMQYEIILRDYPNDRDSLAGLAWAYNQKGEKKQALDILKNAFNLYPNDSEIKGKLDEILNEKNGQ